ncbi:hypothetical protein, partial [Vibrio sp. M260118]|uniref:hypothetical protein n=1 Tax=Vibrio sp. M260118 TaxID=3020896 RepID=UPI002F426DEC
ADRLIGASILLKQPEAQCLPWQRCTLWNHSAAPRHTWEVALNLKGLLNALLTGDNAIPPNSNIVP